MDLADIYRGEAPVLQFDKEGAEVDVTGSTFRFTIGPIPGIITVTIPNASISVLFPLTGIGILVPLSTSDTESLSLGRNTYHLWENDNVIASGYVTVLDA